MKTVLLVPGFGETLEDRDYVSVIDAIASKHYKVQFVPIQWKRKTLMDWVAELAEVYTQYDPANTVLAGFSYGAMTAFVAASKLVPAELWLFSLSPYFTEDLKSAKLVWLHQIGKRRSGVFWKTSFNELCKKISCPTKIFIGSLEAKKYPSMKRRFEDAAVKLPDSTPVIVEKVGHELDHPDYIAAIKANI